MKNTLRKVVCIALVTFSGNASGWKYNSPSVDAGGFPPSAKMEAALKRGNPTKNNIDDAIHFLKEQENALNAIALVLGNIHELKALGKSEGGLKGCQEALVELLDTTSNGIRLFKETPSSFNVVVSKDGKETITISVAYITEAMEEVIKAGEISELSKDVIELATMEVTETLAKNGAEANRMEFASKMLVSNKINLESANSRIKNADITEESEAFAKFNILLQSGAEMLALSSEEQLRRSDMLISQDIAIRLLDSAMQSSRTKKEGQDKNKKY